MDLHLVGGFLGSGKTTAIVEAARLLMAGGKRVGVITNEQGRHLVDTGFLQAGGIPALEVTGGCICCHLDDFADRLEEISAKFDPEVVFAESVGSCTDLVATVIKPMVDFRKATGQPATLSVFTDSRLLLRYLRGQELPFSDAVIYIFEKQIEEASLLIANKIDLLAEADAEDLLQLAAVKYPLKTIRPQNSLDRAQVAEWLVLIQSANRPLPLTSLDIDYNAYADGERLFTWVDREIRIKCKAGGQTALLKSLIKNMVASLTSEGVRIAHLKILVNDGQETIRISLTGMDAFKEKLEEQFGQFARLTAPNLEILFNVMAEGTKAAVEPAVDIIIYRISKQSELEMVQISEFTRVPGKPQPTRRIGN